MFNKIHVTWKPILNIDERRVENFFDNLYLKEDITPQKENIFNSFQFNIKDINVIIIGQDPYPNGCGTGIAFAYNDRFSKPISFKNLEKEVGHELSNSLSEWLEKGIIPINYSLTVIKNKPNSHKEIWKNFTENWIKNFDMIFQNKLFILMGSTAWELDRFIFQNYTIKCPHPASRRNDFVGCGVFKKAEKIINIKF